MARKVSAAHRNKHQHEHPAVEEVKAAFFQLINHHHNIDGVLSESLAAISEPTTLDEKAVDDISNVAFVEAIKDEAVAMGTPVPQVAAVVMATKLKSVLEECRGEHLLLEKCQEICRILTIIKSLIKSPGFSRSTLAKSLLKDYAVLPIELIWRLHNTDILTLDTYIISNLSNPVAVSNLAKSVLMLSGGGSEESRETRCHIITDVFAYLIQQGYADLNRGDAASKGIKKVSTALLDSVLKKLVIQQRQEGWVDVVKILVAQGRVVLDPPVLQKVCMRQLTLLLSLNPQYKVSHAIKGQHEWTSAKCDPTLKGMLHQLIVLLDAEAAVSVLSQVLEQHEVNWKHLLSYLSLLLVTYPPVPALSIVLVKEMLVRGLTNCELDALIAGFLLARQISLEGPHVAGPYSHWFQVTFGGNESLANSKKSFTFLMKFLSDIVPFEPPQYLRVHITKPPMVPTKCRALLVDYISLAKTCLMDLKEPLDEQGIYNENTEAGSSNNEQLPVDQDVERVLVMFEKSGKVPSSVMEASIFKKPYFVGKFLPSLLKARHLPECPDVRMKFIDALLRAEKIPHSLYSSYESSCQKLAMHLLEGVSFEDEDMEDVSPWQLVEIALDNIRDGILAAAENPKDYSIVKAGLNGLVSCLSEKIGVFVDVPNDDIPFVSGIESSPNSVISLLKPELSVKAAKVACAFLDTLCQIFSAESQPLLTLKTPDVAMETDSADVQVIDAHDQSWLLQLLAPLPLAYPAVWRALIYSVVKHSTSQDILTEGQIACLAAILVHLNCFSHLLAAPRIENGQTMTTLDYIFNSSNSYTGTELLHRFRLCIFYITTNEQLNGSRLLHYMEAVSTDLPAVVMEWFQWLAPRFCPNLRSATFDQCHYDHPGLNSTTRELATQLCIRFQKTTKKLSLKDWLHFELKVCPHSDHLAFSDRYSYLEWMLLCVYIPDDDSPCQKGFYCLGEAVRTILDYQHNSLQQRSCNSCPHYPAGSQHSNPGDFLLHAVQKLLLMMPPGDQSNDMLPWLLKLWEHRLVCFREEAYTELVSHTGCLNLFRFSQGLPPSHLFGLPTGGGTVSKAISHKVAALVNTVWCCELSCGVGLQLDAVLYLCQAVTVGLPNPMVQKHFMDICPVVLASALVHRDVLQSVFFLETKSSTLNHCFQSLTQQADRLLSHPVVPCPAVADANSLMLGTAVFAAISNNKLPEGETARVCMERLGNAVHVGHHPEPWLTSLSYCLLVQQSWNTLHQLSSDSFGELCMVLWCALPPQVCLQCWREIITNSNIKDAKPIIGISSRGCHKLLPAILARYVPHLSHLFTEDGALPILLQTHSLAASLYDHNQLPDLPASLNLPSKLPSLETLQQLSSHINAVITQSSQAQMLALDKDSLSMCDPEFGIRIRRTLELAS